MNPFEQRVRERAYYIWEGEGRVFGRAADHWLRAESELQGKGAEAPTLVQPAAADLSLAPSPAKALKAKPARATSAAAKAVSAKAAAPKSETAKAASPKKASAKASAAAAKDAPKTRTVTAKPRTSGATAAASATLH